MKRFLVIPLCVLFVLVQAKPRISIISSVFNGDRFIHSFLDDLSRLTIFDQCEIILINPKSPGNEEPVILNFMRTHSNVIYVKLGVDPGVYGTWNYAIKIASADYITNANLDDRHNPEALEQEVEFLEKNPRIDLVYGDFHVSEMPNQRFSKDCGLPVANIPEFKKSGLCQCLPGPQPLWRKSLHDRFGYFDPSYVIAGDFEMWNRAVEGGAQFQHLPIITGIFYRNRDGISENKSIDNQHVNEINRIKMRYSYFWPESFRHQITKM